ncbi:MAG: hypothetical protein AUJ51_10695 [Elusimicrobia bacterium CG1_02_56_21]|nr:MAG: hypothetical protein AUJ51_10695 [Elusimicrobia bacterium CG1_02_56_21]
MKKILILALLALPAAAYCQQAEDVDPAASDQAGYADSLEPVQRPDTQKIMSELSISLRLSSKQEERISSAVNKKMAQFDKVMKEYDRNSKEEKKWRYKMNANRYEMLKMNRDLPDAIREYLDDEQRQSYDEMLEAREKEAAPAVKPVKKKRLIRRKKAPAALEADEDAGQVMVDKEPASRSKPGKKRVLRRRPAPKPEPAAEEEPAYEDAGSYP